MSCERVSQLFDNTLEPGAWRVIRGEAEQPQSSVGQWFSKVARLEKAWFGPPERSFTPLGAVWCFVTHATTWAVFGIGFPSLLTESTRALEVGVCITVGFAVLEVTQILVLGRLPVGTAFEASIAAFLAGLLVVVPFCFFSARDEQDLVYAYAIWATVFFGVLWVGLGVGFGLRRRLLMGEITMAEIFCQMTAVSILVQPIGIVCMSIATVTTGQVPEKYSTAAILGASGLVVVPPLLAALAPLRIRVFPSQFWMMVTVSGIGWLIIDTVVATWGAVVQFLWIGEVYYSATVAALAAGASALLAWYDFGLYLLKGFQYWKENAISRVTRVVMYFGLSAALMIGTVVVAAVLDRFAGTRLLELGRGTGRTVIVVCVLVAFAVVSRAERAARRIPGLVPDWYFQRPSLATRVMLLGDISRLALGVFRDALGALELFRIAMLRSVRWNVAW